jgi:hypothetical protein
MSKPLSNDDHKSPTCPDGNTGQSTIEGRRIVSNDEIALAGAIYLRITTKISALDKGKTAYWDSVSDKQLLANLGYSQAKKFMLRIEISRAPKCRNERTAHSWLTKVPAGVAFKGMRRQLHADATSPNKTFGMRPHWARDDNSEQF